MDDKAWQLLIEKINSIEEDIKEIKIDQKDQNKVLSGLKIKVATFSSFFGIIAAYLKTKFGQ